MKHAFNLAKVPLCDAAHGQNGLTEKRATSLGLEQIAIL